MEINYFKSPKHDVMLDWLMEQKMIGYGLTTEETIILECLDAIIWEGLAVPQKHVDWLENTYNRKVSYQRY